MQLRPIFHALVVALAVTACSQRDKKPRLPLGAVVGVWRSDAMPAADASVRVFQLRMEPDGLAEFTSESAGRSTLTERGTWDGADSLVRVVVRRAGTASRATSLLLAIRGNTLGLVGVDTTAFGPAGLILTRR